MADNVHYINNAAKAEASQIEDEALDWLIMLDRDEEPSQQELANLKAWLKQSDEHKQALQKLNQFWQNQVLTELFVPLPQATVQPKKSNNRFAWVSPSLAASFVFVISLAIYFIQPLTTQLVHTEATYITQIGQQLEQTLPDGSILYLNTNSQVEIDYTEAYRNLKLVKGEAHFSVAKNKNRPFRVYAAGARVEAIGTAFTVQINNDNLDVVVTEGVVALAANKQGHHYSTNDTNIQFDPFQLDNELVTLGAINAGSRAQLNTLLSATELKQNLNQWIKPVTDSVMTQSQSWMKGTLVFLGDPLQTVIDEISRFTPLSIEIQDPSIKNLDIGGRFKVGEVEQFLNLLEANFPIEVTYIDQNKVVLTGREL